MDILTDININIKSEEYIYGYLDKKLCLSNSKITLKNNENYEKQKDFNKRLEPRKKYIINKLDNELNKLKNSNEYTKINYKQIEHIIKFFQTFVFEDKIKDPKLFEEFRNKLMYYDKKSLSDFKNEYIKSAAKEDEFTKRCDIKLGFGNFTKNFINLKDFYINLLNIEKKIVENITINDKEWCKKIGLKIKLDRTDIRKFLFSEDKAQAKFKEYQKYHILTLNTGKVEEKDSFTEKIKTLEKFMKQSSPNFIDLLKYGLFKNYENKKFIKKICGKEEYKILSKIAEIYRLNILILYILEYYIKNDKNIKSIERITKDDKNPNTYSFNVKLRINDLDIEINYKDYLKDYFTSDFEAIETTYRFLETNKSEEYVKNKIIEERKKLDKKFKEYLIKIFNFESDIVIELKKNGKVCDKEYIDFNKIVEQSISSPLDKYQMLNENDYRNLKTLRNAILHNCKEGGEGLANLTENTINDIFNKIK